MRTVMEHDGGDGIITVTVTQYEGSMPHTTTSGPDDAVAVERERQLIARRQIDAAAAAMYAAAGLHDEENRIGGVR